MSALDMWSNDWETCEAKTSDFITPPDGKYEVEVESVDYEEVDDRRGGCYPQFTWVFRRMASGANISVQVKSSTKTKQNGEPYKECYIQGLLKKSEWMMSGRIPPAPQAPQPQYSQQAQQQYPQNNGWSDNVSRYDAPCYSNQNDEIPF